MLIPNTHGGHIVAAGGAVTQQDVVDLGPILFLSTADLNNTWTDTGPATTNISDDGDNLAQWDNLGTLGGSAFQATGADQPEYDLTSGVRSFIADATDGGPHVEFAIANPGNGHNIFCTFKHDGSRLNGMVAGADVSANFIGAYASGSSSTNLDDFAGSPTIWVDGVQVTTRGAMYTAIAASGWHIIEIRNADLNSNSASVNWDVIRPVFYGGGGFGPGGNYSDYIVIPTANFDSDDRDNIILPWLNAQVGL